jgi:hypothetical protein
MTLPDRLITEPPRGGKDRASNELSAPAVLHIVSTVLAITPGTPFEELERNGVTLTGAQLKELCKRIQSDSSASVRAEHREALDEADERWRERLDLAVEAMRMYPGAHRDRPMQRIADAVGFPGKTNLRVTMETRFGDLVPTLREEAADAAIEAILTRLANPTEGP